MFLSKTTRHEKTSPAIIGGIKITHLRLSLTTRQIVKATASKTVIGPANVYLVETVIFENDVDKDIKLSKILQIISTALPKIPHRKGIELVNIKIGARYKTAVARAETTRLVNKEIKEISLK